MATGAPAGVTTMSTPGAAQRLMAGALGVPVAVMETAGEGGPWGMALLAAYKIQRLAVKQAVQRRFVQPGPGRLQGFPENPDPGVQIAGAGVAVNHG